MTYLEIFDSCILRGAMFNSSYQFSIRMHIHQIGKNISRFQILFATCFALPLHIGKLMTPLNHQFLESVELFYGLPNSLENRCSLKECSCFFKTTIFGVKIPRFFSEMPPPLCSVPWNHPINAKWLTFYRGDKYTVTSYHIKTGFQSVRCPLAGCNGEGTTSLLWGFSNRQKGMCLPSEVFKDY